jgi:BMFP domain-containing protein YqiC
MQAMQTDNRFLNDLSKLATGAAGAVQGLKQEIETLVRQRLEKMLADLDLVQREEFEAVREMARKAREENDSLLARIAVLEGKPAAKPAPRRTATKGGASRSAAGVAKKP